MAWTQSSRSGNASGISLLTTELNSLANAGRAISSVGGSSGVFDNDADKDQLADLELAVTFGANATADATVSVYFIRTVDGTNFEDGVSGLLTPSVPTPAVFITRAATAHRLVCYGILVPPRDFMVLLVNNSGQAFPASGSTLKAFFYS